DLANVEVVEDGEEGTKVDVFELKESADEAPVVKLVNMVLVDAIQKGASDIHFESYEKIFRIRFRMDGVLHEMLAPPKRLESAILSRLKIMSNLDIAERRPPPGRRRAAAAAGRTHQAPLQHPRDRLPRVDAPHHLRREGGPPNPRQGVTEARPDAARLRRVDPREVQRRHPPALRHDPDHRTDRI